MKTNATPTPNTTTTTDAPDWVEVKTAALLRSAKRSGFFANVIADTKHFHAQGYVWDVDLSIACNYWCS